MLKRRVYQPTTTFIRRRSGTETSAGLASSPLGDLASRKAELEVEKLQLEIAIAKAKGKFETVKLRTEAGHIRQKARLDADKLAAEIRELRRPYWAKNFAPAATILAAAIGITGTIWLNASSERRESVRRTQENIAKQLGRDLGARSTPARLAAARQFGELDPEIAFAALSDIWADAVQGTKLGGATAHQAARFTRTGVMEAAGIREGSDRLSIDRRRDLLVRGLRDEEPMVRHKALAGLLAIRAWDDVKNYRGSVLGKQIVVREMVDRFEMLRLPSGAAVIGSDTDRRDEGPAVQVPVVSFLIDPSPVTNQMWNSVMGLDTPTDFERAIRPQLSDWRRSLSNANRPVLGASASQAREFCNRSGQRRLPTEREWEYAARGADGWTFTWGEVAEPGAKVLQRQQAYAGPVGMAQMALATPDPEDVSIFQVRGMTTAVREWTDTEFVQPHGEQPPPSCQSHCVVKGAAAYEADPAEFGDRRMRASRRHSRPKDHGDDLVGFRCARS